MKGDNEINWKKIAICFMFLFVVSGIYLIFAGNKPYEELSNYVTCSEIKGTPAWVEDEQINYGYKEDWKEVPKGVYFYYHPDCFWCKEQIKNFGEEYFTQLKKEGRAIDCSQ